MPLSMYIKQINVSKNAYSFSKRVFDLFIVLIISPILCSVIFLIASVIWLGDRRNPFFVQMRTGLHGKRFPMYKFRTMLPNADAMKEDIMYLNELDYPDFKIKDDPRVTKIGHFLRRTSLDELPQFFNVLVGNMSLVGPRPTSFKVETYAEWHKARLEVIPGITGLWQISGRSDVNFDDRVKLDIEYIQHQSFLFDLKILLHTVGSVFQKDGAY